MILCGISYLSYRELHTLKGFELKIWLKFKSFVTKYLLE